MSPRGAPRIQTLLAVVVVAVAAAAAGAIVHHHDIATAQPLTTGDALGGGTAVDDAYGPGERLLPSDRPGVFTQTVLNRSSHPVTIESAGESFGDHVITSRWVPSVNGGLGEPSPSTAFPAVVPPGGQVGVVLTFPAHLTTDPGGRLTFDTVTVVMRYRGQTLTRDVPFGSPVVVPGP